MQVKVVIQLVKHPTLDTLPPAGSGSGKKDLADFLISAGKLSLQELDRARRLQEEQLQGDPLGALLVKLGLLSDQDVAQALTEHLGLPLVEKKAFPDQPVVAEAVSSKFLKESQTLILAEDDDRITVVMANPEDSYVIDALKLITGKAVEPCVGVASEIAAALDQIYRQEREDGEAPGVDGGADSALYNDDVEHLKELASEAPVIKMVNQMIHHAVESGASDIHIEPFENRLKVRYRIDGLLRETESPPAHTASAVVSRIKIMANLNIAERRLPQDGRLKVRVGGRLVDLRVSTIPTMYGESLVLRILQRDEMALDFDPLGFSPEIKQTLLDILDKPHGILLVTGPTGSGKTTTLYAALKTLNTPERKIVTVEDPVEYNIEDVNQVQVKPKIGLTFANALRSIVRQDPDVIMIGEMRDQETARIAVQSALTGHLVLSTLHTNNAAGSISRLLDMGVEDYLLTSTVEAVLAQRLVRVLCPHCRQQYTPMEDIIRLLRLAGISDENPVLYRAVGCEQCDGIGYAGRIALIELMVMTDSLRHLIVTRADTTEIAKQSAKEGYPTMFHDGMRKAMDGITSVEEVIRVTQEA